MPEFMLLALIGGTLTTLMTAPVGAFMLWRRMAYFGDALAHTTLLGMGLGIWLQMPLHLSMIMISLIVAISITLLHQRHNTSTDTLLAIAAHSSLGLGMIVIALLPEARIDLMGYLFGDLLSLTTQDIILLALTNLFVVTIIYKKWRALLLNTINPDLATLAGHNNQQINLLLALLIAVVVAISIKLVGALLMTALLITPAATARPFSRTPFGMIVGAVIIGQLGIFAGLSLSWYYDLPVAPSIVSFLFATFLLSRALPNKK
ncbi:MAG: metal ABC transporter permease [Proteobacteria bacterium]|nr:metal ABC transporter permease [Pseudomonadota bacterium]